MSTPTSSAVATQAPAVTVDNAQTQVTALKVERIQVSMLYEQLQQGLIATVINAAAMAWILSSAVDKVMTGIWFGLMASVSAARLLLLRRYNAESQVTIDVGLWHNRFKVGAIVSAILWGSAGVLLFPGLSTQHQAFIGFVLAGMAAGAAGSMVADDKAFRTFLIISIGPYLLRLTMEGQAVNLAMTS